MNIIQKYEHLETIIKNMNELSTEEQLQKALEIDQDSYQEILKQKAQGNRKVCLASIETGQICYSCFDCSNNENHIYCQACLDPQKHINHLVTYSYSSSGYCDCGDENSIKKESFCDNHKSDNQIPIIQINEIIRHKYRQFIQISFALLFTKIEQLVDYTIGFKQEIFNAFGLIYDQKLFDFLEGQQDQFNKVEQIADEIQRLYCLNTDIIKELTTDNISLSLLTSELLQQPIDDNIQQYISFYHNHNQQIRITKQQEICKCSILELYIKFNGFISQIIPENERHFPELFYPLLLDQEFKPYFYQLIIQNLNNLLMPIKKYKFITQCNDSFKITMKKEIYSDQTSMLEIVKIISENNQITKTVILDDLLEGELLTFHFLIEQQIIFQILESKTNQFFRSFKIFFQKMIQVPILNNSSHQISTRFFFLVRNLFQCEAQKRCLQQIITLAQSEDELFFNQKIIPSSNIFQLLQKNSFFIYFITRAFPCKIFNLGLLVSKNKAKYYSRYLEKHFLEFYYFIGHYSDIVSKNVMRIILNYYFSKKQNDFELNQNDSLKNFLSNSVFSDRNIILILSFYLEQFQQTSDVYNDLLEVSNNDPIQLKQVLFNILRRTLVNYQILQTEGDINLYKGQKKIFLKSKKISEIALEQVDIAFIQMYAFIFGSDGINDIINQFSIIRQGLNVSTDVTNLILRISQSDFDLIQCQGLNQKQQLSEQVIKGLNKLFQTIFFATTFYNTKDLIEILKQFSYDINFDIQQFILSSCELNPNNDSLQLKQSLQPPQYEPVFAQQVLSLKEKIDDKLKTEGDYFKQLFGTALAHELQNSKSSLTFKRLAILKAISYDDRQLILNEIITYIQIYYYSHQFQQENLNQISSLLEEKAVYINLLFQSNKTFGPNKIIQVGLQQIQKINYEIVKSLNIQNLSSVFCNFILLLDEQSLLDLQLLSDDEYKNKKQQLKRQYLKDKFKYMSKPYQLQIKQDLQGEYIDNCSLCKLNFNQTDLKYKTVLIQFTNFHNYQKFTKVDHNLTFDILKHTISSCGHIFHENCLKHSIKGKSFGDSQYYVCPTCSLPYNFAFLNPLNITTFKNQELLVDLNRYLKNIAENVYLEYFDRYTKDNELQVNLVVNELFTCSLCNLLVKLLSNTEDFYNKKQYLLLQDIVHLLRLAYKENQQSILEFANINTNELLFGLLNAIQNFLIAGDNVNEFEAYLKTIFDQNQYQLVLDLITKQEINNQNVLSLQIYNEQLYHSQIRKQYIDFFPGDFKQFLIMYNMTPCQKKLCKSRPQFLIQGQENLQYFCLICLKKMCSQNCGWQTNGQGNLTRHAIKKHKSKTVYLQISSSKIIILFAPNVLYCDQTLYQNLISEQPTVGIYGSSYYENFKLNQKGIEMIVDTISGEKYLQKMFSNTQKILDGQLL